MLLCSVKASDIKITIVSLICAAVFVIACFFSLRLAPADTIDVSGEAVSLKAESEKDVLSFLENCGHKPERIVYKKDIVIPSVYNDVYSKYVAFEKECGFELEKYKGKEAVLYIAKLEGNEGFAEVVAADSRIAAAHISTMKPGEGYSSVVSGG